MAATMKDWLGPQLDRWLEGRLLQVQQEEKAVSTDNAESQSRDSRGLFRRNPLRIPQSRGGHLQIIKVVNTKPRPQVILSDSNTWIEAYLEPRDISAAEEARRGGENTIEKALGGVVVIKDFDFLLVLEGDGSARIFASVREWKIKGSEGSKTFGVPKPIEGRVSTIKFLKKWNEIAGVPSIDLQNKDDSKTLHTRQDELEEYPGKIDENARAPKRIKRQRAPQMPIFRAWVGKKRLSKRDVTIPRDQEKLLGRKESWIPGETGQETPSARLPQKLLQHFCQQAVIKAEQGLLDSSQLSQLPPAPESSAASSSSKSTTSVPKAVQRRTSPKALTRRLEEPHTNIDSTPNTNSSDGSSSESWPPTPSQKLRNWLPPDSGDSSPSSFCPTPDSDRSSASCPSTPSRELRNRLPPDSGNEKIVLAQSKRREPKKQTKADTRSFPNSGASINNSNDDECQRADNARKILKANQSLNGGQQDTISVTRLEANSQCPSSQLEDGLESTTTSQRLLTSLIHDASSQPESAKESLPVPELNSNHSTSITRGSRLDSISKILDESKLGSEETSAAPDFRNAQSQPSIRAQTGEEDLGSGDDDEKSDDTDVEMSGPTALNQEAKIGLLENTGQENKLESSQQLMEVAEDQQKDFYTDPTVNQVSKNPFVVQRLSDHTSQSNSSPGIGHEIISEDHQMPLVRVSQKETSRPCQDHLQLEQESLCNEEMSNQQFQCEIISSQPRYGSQQNFLSDVPIYEERLTLSASPKYTTPLRGMISRKSITTTKRSKAPLWTLRKRKISLVSEQEEYPTKGKRHRAGTSGLQARRQKVDKVGTAPASVQRVSQEAFQTPIVFEGSQRNDHPLKLRNRFIGESRGNPQQLDTNKDLRARPAVEDPNVFQVFRATYPDFQASLGRFVMPCFLLQQRVKAGKAVHKSLWDDFVGRFSSDFEKWSYGISFDDYYDEFVDEPAYTKKVLNPLNLQEAIMLDPETIASMQTRYSRLQKSASRSGSRQTSPDFLPEKSQQSSLPETDRLEEKMGDQNNYTQIQDSISSNRHHKVSVPSSRSSPSPLHLKGQNLVSRNQHNQPFSLEATPERLSQDGMNATSIFPQSGSNVGVASFSECSNVVPASHPATPSRHAPRSINDGPFRTLERPHQSRNSASPSSSEFPPLSTLLATSNGKSKAKIPSTAAEAKVLTQDVATSSQGFSPSIKGQPGSSIPFSQSSLSSTPSSGLQDRNPDKQPSLDRVPSRTVAEAPPKTGKDFQPPMASGARPRVDLSEAQRQTSSARVPVEQLSLRRESGTSPNSRSSTTSTETSASISVKKAIPPIRNPVIAEPKKPAEVPLQSEADWWQDRKTPFKDFVRNFSKLKSEQGRLGVVSAQTGLLVPPSFLSSSTTTANIGPSSSVGRGKKIDVLSWDV